MTIRSALSIASCAVLSAATLAPACAASGACSNDVFTVDGTVLTIAVCDRAPATAPAPRVTSGTLVETFSVKDRTPIVHSVAYDRLPSETTTRTIDDVALGALGISRTLHLTVAIRDRGVRLEHALLVPGAIDLR